MKSQNIQIIRIIIFLVILGGIILGGSKKALAQSEQTYFLDQITVQKGYTLQNYDQSFKLGIRGEVLSKPARVILKEEGGKSQNLPQGKRAISQYQVFDIQNHNKVLEKPLILVLKYHSDNFHPKNLYFWDNNQKEWRVLPSQVDYQGREVKSFFHLPYAQLVVLEDIESLFRIKLDKDTLERGYTVINSNSEFSLALMPKILDLESITVVLKSGVLGDKSLPENKNLISNIYSFELKGEVPPFLQKPLILNLKYQKETPFLKQAYFWDNNQKAWRVLPSDTNYQNQTVRFYINLPYAEVGIFEDSDFREDGYASWYWSRNPYGAASNDYPYLTKLEVTNLANNKSVIVTVISQGPFVPDRIIDLAHGAFREIANLRLDGVVRVKVRKI